MNPTSRFRNELSLIRRFGFWRYLTHRVQDVNESGERSFGTISRLSVSRIDNYDEIYNRLVDSLRYVFGMAVEGHVAEFGTMTGKSSVAIASGLSRLNYLYRNDPRGAKKVYYFDSFIGLPSVTETADMESPHVKQGTWFPGACRGFDSLDFAKVIEKYASPSDFHVIKGWFSDTIPTLDSSIKFSFIHIDCDLYSSARDVLFGLFEGSLVSDGAIICFDDFYCNQGSPLFGERRAWSEAVEVFRIQYTDLGPYSIGGHSVLIHDYRGHFPQPKIV